VPAETRAREPAAVRELARGLHDGDPPARLEFDDAGGQREEREVASAADVATRVEHGAALPHDDLAGLDGLTAVALDAAELRIGVAAVASRARTFFVCSR
jgi:hypothetical protein